MTQLVVWSLLGAFGALLLIRGMFPPRPTLAERLSETGGPAADTAANLKSLWARIGLFMITLTQRDKLSHVFKPNLAVNQIELEDFARDKLNAALGAGVVLAIVGILFGWLGSARAILFVAFIGFVIGFILPDIEQADKAQKRRVEFSESLTAFISLVAVCLSGGGGVNSAMSDALSVGGGWPFQMLRANLNESNIRGESYWSGFDRLGRELDVEDLIELAGALGLAGSSGARVTDSLRARAESSRQKERQAVLTEAEKASERLNIPIAILALSWMAFIGYPAVMQLVGA